MMWQTTTDKRMTVSFVSLIVVFDGNVKISVRKAAVKVGAR